MSRMLGVPRAWLLLAVAAGVCGGMAVLAGESGVEEWAVLGSGILAVAVSGWLMHGVVGVWRLRRVSIPGIWYLTYLAFLLVPSYWVFFDRSGSSRYLYMAAIQGTLVTVPLGMVLIRAATRFRIAEIDAYFASAIEGDSRASFLTTAWMLTACVAVVVLYVSEVKALPFVYMLRNPGDAMNAMLLREESFKLLDTRFKYLYTLVQAPILPILLLTCLGYGLGTRRKSWWILFAVTLMTALAYASFTLAKAPVAALVLLLFVFLLLYRGGRLKWWMLCAPVLILAYPLGVVVAVDFGEVTGEWVLVALEALWGRLLYLPAEVVYWYFALLPGGSLGGTSSQGLAWLMGWRYFNVENYVGLHGLGGSGSISANGAFIGYLYVDFGITGVLFGGLLAGALMQGAQVYLVRRTKDPVGLAAYAYLLFAAWLLHSTALPIALISHGALGALVMPSVFRRCRGIVAGHPKAMSAAQVLLALPGKVKSADLGR